jgi:Uma2 family endonuclease
MAIGQIYSQYIGAKTAISLEQYLHTTIPDVDREYRDGEIIGRSAPDYLHGRVQGAIFAFFWALRTELALFPCVETRMRLRSNLILIPDVAVFYPTEPSRVPDAPPLLVAEVLSLDDRLTAVREKLEEYKSWGVPHVWLVDPHLKRLYMCDKGLMEVALLQIPELGIELLPGRIFD